MLIGLRCRFAVWIGVGFGFLSISHAEIRYARHSTPDLIYASGQEVRPDGSFPPSLTNVRVSSFPGIRVASGFGESKRREFWLEIMPIPETNNSGSPWRYMAELPRNLGRHAPVVEWGSIWTIDTTTVPFKLIRYPLFDPKPVWKTVGSLPEVSLSGMSTIDADSLYCSRDGDLVLHGVQNRGKSLVGTIAAGADRVEWSVVTNEPESIPQGMSQLLMGFDIAATGTFLTLTWENVAHTVMSYRISPGLGQLYGPWSDTYSNSPHTINERGRFIQYRLERHVPDGKWPSEVILTYELDREPEISLGPTISPEPIPDRPLPDPSISHVSEESRQHVSGPERKPAHQPSGSRFDDQKEPPKAKSAIPDDEKQPEGGTGSAGGTASPQLPGPLGEKPADSANLTLDSRFQPLPVETPQSKQVGQDTSPRSETASSPAENQDKSHSSESKSPQTPSKDNDDRSPKGETVESQPTPGESDAPGGETSDPNQTGSTKDSITNTSARDNAIPNPIGDPKQNEGLESNRPSHDSKVSNEKVTDSKLAEEPQSKNTLPHSMIAAAGAGGGSSAGGGEGGRDSNPEQDQPASSGNKTNGISENKTGQSPPGEEPGASHTPGDRPSESANMSPNKSPDSNQPGAEQAAENSSPESNAAGNDGKGEDASSSASDEDRSGTNDDSDAIRGAAGAGDSSPVPGALKGQLGNTGSGAGLSLPKEPILKQRGVNPILMGIAAVFLAIGAGVWLWILFRKRKRDSHQEPADEGRHPVSISVSVSPVVDNGQQDETSGVENSDVDTAPKEEVRTTDEALVWESIGLLPGDLELIATQHPRFIYGIDVLGRVFRFAHDALPEEPTRPQRALCFSPVRQNCVALAASTNYLVTIGTPGVGDVTVALANLTENGGVELWHTIPYPSHLDVPVAVAIRNKALWILGTDGSDIQLVRSNIQESGPSRVWHIDARAPMRGEVLGGAIVPRMGFALTDCPDRRSYLSVLKTHLGEKSGFHRVADLPWSGREVAVTSLGPELYVMDRGGFANEGHISRVPLENSDRPRAWLTGPSGLEIHGPEFFFQTHKGKLIVLFRSSETVHSNQHAPWILTAASPS